jgi:hypothetical protein
MVSGYENLIAWGEKLARNVDGQGLRTGPELRDAIDYLRAERARVDRFRRDMGFLEKRRSVG